MREKQNYITANTFWGLSPQLCLTVLNPPCLIHIPYHALRFLVVGSENERFNKEHPGNSNQSKYDQETLHFLLKGKTTRRAKSYFTSFRQLHL